jgi:hypothetical protein
MGKPPPCAIPVILFPALSPKTAFAVVNHGRRGPVLGERVNEGKGERLMPCRWPPLRIILRRNPPDRHQGKPPRVQADHARPHLGVLAMSIGSATAADKPRLPSTSP